MPSTLRDICFDCRDAVLCAGFWSSVLDYQVERGPETDAVSIQPRDGTGLRIWFNAVPEPKVSKNRVHIDINMSDESEMERLLTLGATKIREIRGDDGALWWTIMADPEGNEFCAFPPRP